MPSFCSLTKFIFYFCRRIANRSTAVVAQNPAKETKKKKKHEKILSLLARHCCAAIVLSMLTATALTVMAKAPDTSGVNADENTLYSDYSKRYTNRTNTQGHYSISARRYRVSLETACSGGEDFNRIAEYEVYDSADILFAHDNIGKSTGYYVSLSRTWTDTTYGHPFRLIVQHQGTNLTLADDGWYLYRNLVRNATVGWTTNHS